MASSPIVLPNNDATNSIPAGTSVLLNSMFVIGSPRESSYFPITSDSSDYHHRSVLISGSSNFVDEKLLHSSLSHYGEVEHMSYTEHENVYSVTFRNADSVRNLMSRAPVDKQHSLDTMRIHSLGPTTNGTGSTTHYPHEASMNTDNSRLNGGNRNAVSNTSTSTTSARKPRPVDGNSKTTGGGATAAVHGQIYRNIPRNVSGFNRIRGPREVYSQIRGPPAVNYPPSASSNQFQPSGPRISYPMSQMPMKMNAIPRPVYNGAGGLQRPPPPPPSHLHFHNPPTQYNNPKGIISNEPGLTFAGTTPASPLFFKENYPTRILVNNDLIGAIIGRSGEKIKEITSATGARVDVKREVVGWCQYKGGSVTTPGSSSNNNNTTVRPVQSKDSTMIGTSSQVGQNSTSDSQIVFIYGSPENTSLAIRRIMDICMKEAENANHTEKPHLGLLTEDRFCGRIIGKEGKNLNLIREETGAIVYVSNAPIVTQLLSHPHQYFTLDRIIDIRGTLDAICKAEDQISAKLRQCHRHDLQRGHSPGGGATTPDIYNNATGNHPMSVTSTALGQPSHLAGPSHNVNHSTQQRGSANSRIYPPGSSQTNNGNTAHSSALPPGVAFNPAGPPYPSYVSGIGPSTNSTHPYPSMGPGNSALSQYHPHPLHGSNIINTTGHPLYHHHTSQPPPPPPHHHQQHPHHHTGPPNQGSPNQTNISPHYRTAGPYGSLHPAPTQPQTNFNTGGGGGAGGVSSGPNISSHNDNLQLMAQGNLSFHNHNAAAMLMYGSPSSHTFDNGPLPPPPPSSSANVRSGGSNLLDTNLALQNQSAANSPPACVIHSVLGEGFELDESLYMRIPHVSAGAVIGTDGASIKKIMDDTKTMVTVSKVENASSRNKQSSQSGCALESSAIPDSTTDNKLDESFDGQQQQLPPPPQQQQDRLHSANSPLPASMMQRKVIIKGSAGNQMRAQWHIFQRVKNSSRQSEADAHPLCPIADCDLCLWTIVRVPRALVGRIIGKGGRTVYNIQSSTGTIINLPKEVQASYVVSTTTATSNNDSRKRVASTAESGHSDNSLTVKECVESVTAATANVGVDEEKDNKEDTFVKKSNIKNQDPSEVNNAFFQPVEIFGTFENTQLALGRIRALVNQALIQLYHQGQTLELVSTQSQTGQIVTGAPADIDTDNNNKNEDSDLTSSEPALTDPTSSGPASSDPTLTEPTSTDPTLTEPTSTDPTSSDPISSDPTSSDPISSNPTSDKTSSDPIPSDKTSSDPTSSDPPTTIIPTTDINGSESPPPIVDSTKDETTSKEGTSNSTKNNDDFQACDTTVSDTKPTTTSDVAMVTEAETLNPDESIVISTSGEECCNKDSA